jgi:predicted dehydrogenase
VQEIVKITLGARKLARFIGIHGPGRAMFKAAGRLRLPLPLWALRSARRDIGIVGCGQFAFATIGYFLWRAFGNRILTCYDVNPSAQGSLAKGFRVPHLAASFSDLLDQPGLKIVYIASNHASHADYAAAAIQRGLDVYVEKPIAVTYGQLVKLLGARQSSKARVYAGYNRPFSPAIRYLRRNIAIDRGGGISLQCFITGHHLAPDHWYRHPEEGTRICGNVGHWLDMMVHIFSWRGLPDRLMISLSWADEREPDENLSISISSDRGDIASIVLSARAEPFEGINETINLQHADTVCKIDDFRQLTIWKGPILLRRRFWPKDVGHRNAILQPFSHDEARNWVEVVSSTLLMLHIANMVRERTPRGEFSFEGATAQLGRDLGAAS